MHTGYHVLIGSAADIPIISPKPIISFSPVVLPAPSRLLDLELRVTVPSSGDALPIVLSHDQGGNSHFLSSLKGYTPLYEFWAAHGFSVLQPTHLSSEFLGLKASKGNELFRKDRAMDMVRILDNLDIIEATVPGLKSGLYWTRVAAAIHSSEH